MFVLALLNDCFEVLTLKAARLVHITEPKEAAYRSRLCCANLFHLLNSAAAVAVCLINARTASIQQQMSTKQPRSRCAACKPSSFVNAGLFEFKRMENLFLERLLKYKMPVRAATAAATAFASIYKLQDEMLPL